MTTPTDHLVPIDLTCDFLPDPLGIDNPTPRLGWKYATARNGLTQRDVEVIVASTPEKARRGEADVWTSGVIHAPSLVWLHYAGPALRSGQRVYWTVRATDSEGRSTMSEQVASWEMGLLQREKWQGKWITPRIPSGFRAHNGLARKSFALDKPVKKARLYLSAQGLYVGSLNGKPVSEHYFRPGWTDYKKRVQYQAYDVTDSLRQGDNVLGLQMGDGWYSGEIGWGHGCSLRDHYGQVPRLLAQLVVDFQDGTQTTIASDKTWRSSPSAIVTSDFLMGEVYDARRETALTGCDQPGFNDAAWTGVEAQDLGEVPLVAGPGPAVIKWGELKPLSVNAGPGGTHIFDLGQNMVGFARLRVRGQAGQTVILRFGEMINPDGTLYTDNLRRARATDQYTLKGGGEEIWEPKFSFHGFRYVEVTGYPGEPSADAITGIVLTSDTPQAGTFECSSAMVNQLQSNIVWGQRGNFLEVPTDCPQRDERLGWMGDAQIFARTATYNADVAAFFKKWTLDVIDAQSPQGAFSDIVPRIILDSTAAPAWGDAGVIVPMTMYEVYGDRALLARQYPSMKKWIDYLDAANPDHLWRQQVGNNFGDWLSVGADAKKDVLSTAYFAHSTSLVARAAAILDFKEDAARYTQLAETIKSAYNREFVAEDFTIAGGTQTAYVLALSFDLLPDAKRAAAVEHLVKDIHAHNDHLTTGFLGVGHLLPVLSRHGHADLAGKLLLNDTFPSWGYSIRHGATTIWERWNGWTAEHGFFDPGMNSFNHYALGSVGEWLYRYVAGINADPRTSAYERLILHPRILPGLTYAKAQYDSVRGRIASHWQRKGDQLTWQVTIPPTATALARLPGNTGDSLRVNGEKVASRLEVAHGGVPDYAEVQLGPGKHTLTANLPPVAKN